MYSIPNDPFDSQGDSQGVLTGKPFQNTVSAMFLFLLKGLSKTVGALPLPAALAFGRGLGRLYGAFPGRRRADACAALRRSFPDKSEAECRALLQRMYLHLGMNVIEELRMPSVSLEYLDRNIIWENESHVRDVLANGKGLLALTAHLGNFDLLTAIPPHFNYPTTVITKTIKNSVINTWWMEARSRFGVKFAPAHNSYRQCLSALRKNEIIGFVLDQNMINTEGIFVDFFGTPACTSPGLAYMSAQSGAAVVPVFMIRGDGGTHRIRMLAPIAPPPDRKPETILHYTQLYTKVIEDAIRETPEQWLWLHRRWKTVPPQVAAPVQQSA